MPAKEIVKKIKKIEIKTRKAVSSLIGGEYHSVFRGRGIEFDEVRHYAPGDQISAIDWKVTARTGVPFVKQFSEERELTVILAVDVSASQDFGSGSKRKKDITTEIGALIALSAIQNNDRVGLLTFSDRVETYLPPRKGKTHGMTVIKELIAMSSEGRRTSLVMALDYLAKILKKKSIVFLLSDFIDQGYEKKINILSRKHDLIAIRIQDPLEHSFPHEGLLNLRDAESGETFTIDPSDKRWQEEFARTDREEEHRISSFFRKHRIDCINIDTASSYMAPLRNFFKKRSARY